MNESRRDVNPFPGLRPFETDEYLLFFGREGQSDELLARLGRTRFLAVVGTSGSGKSSLVRAGLLPAMRGGLMKGAGSGWRIAVMRPGHDPIGNLSCALSARGVLAEAGGGLQGAEAEAIIEATLRTGSLGLVDAVRQARLGEHENLLVVVDQFEELFRFRAARTGTADEASAFVKLLLEAARQRELPVYVVLTMRSDFLGDCAQFQGLPEAINDGQYLIPRMTRDERRLAITGPVAVARGRIAEPLVSRLLNDVGDSPDQLPILQHALMRTWGYWKLHGRPGEPIDVAHYEAVGTMSDALSRHADKAWGELPDERSRQIAEKMFRALTERGADNRETRRPTRLREIAEIAGASEAEVVAVIEVFRRVGRSFLMPPSDVELTGESVIDISHESLIRNWQRLKEWVADEAQSARIYRRLAETAALHHEGREGLMQDPALGIALDWRERSGPNAAWGRRYHPEFEQAITYLEESRAARDAAEAERERERQEEIERERREREQAERFAAQQGRAARRMRRLTFAMILLALLSAGTAAYAMVARYNALRAREALRAALDDAELSRREAVMNARAADEAKRSAERSLEAEQKATDELEEQTAAAKQSEEMATRANAQAQLARKRAEVEKAHAKENAAEASRNAEDARRNLKVARAAQASSDLALKRGELMRQGMAAYRHEDYELALGYFRELRTHLQNLNPDASAPPGDARRNYAEELGWTLSNMGAALQKTGDFPEAVKQYEAGVPILEQTRKDDPALLNAYQGLAHSYHAVAKSEQEVVQLDGYGNSPEDNAKAERALNESRTNFKNAEDFFGRALTFQERNKKEKPSEIAGGHLNLARLYVDSGDFDKAEQSFKAAVELLRPAAQKQSGGAGDRGRLVSGPIFNEDLSRLTGVLRELADFYEEKQERYDDAIAVYNQMLSLWEAGSFINSLRTSWQEVADTYSDLAQIYALKGETQKTRDAFNAANLIQRAALKVRLLRRIKDGEKEMNKAGSAFQELNTDLEELGDAFARLDKPGPAEQLYLKALDNREALDKAEAKQRGVGVSHHHRFDSYYKLSTFYLKHRRDYQKAEHYKQLLASAYAAEPTLATRYAEAQVQLADNYAKEPGKAAEAADAYERALAIYSAQGRWPEENTILYKLDTLHRKQNNLPERERAIQRRLDTLTRAFKFLTGPGKDRSKVPVVLVTEYLNAAERAGLVYNRQKKDDMAEDALRRAFDAYDFIVATDNPRISQNPVVLDAYATVLDRYADLLNQIGRRDAATGVAQKIAAVRKKSRELAVRQLETEERAQQDTTTPATTATN